MMMIIIMIKKWRPEDLIIARGRAPLVMPEQPAGFRRRRKSAPLGPAESDAVHYSAREDAVQLFICIQFTVKSN